MLSVEAAAGRLGVSERRVRALIAAGRLPAERVGRAWVIQPAALGQVEGERPVGRPLGVVAAWRELLGDAPVPGFDVALVRARYRRRAAVERLAAPDVVAAVADPALVVGGWAAAVRLDPLLDEDDAAPLVRYVAASELPSWRARHWVVPSAAGSIVVRAVPDEAAARLRSFDRVVPARVAAVDLAEMSGPRVHEAARRLWAR